MLSRVLSKTRTTAFILDGCCNSSLQMSDYHLVFVFGTLKADFPNHRMLTDCECIGIYSTRYHYALYLVGPRYSPWLIDEQGMGKYVSGEVYRVDNSTLSGLDKLERVSEADGYFRTCIELQHSVTNTPLVANCYFKRKEQLINAEIRLGPLTQYQPEHALLYRPRWQ